jgi:hypothetical protein
VTVLENGRLIGRDPVNIVVSPVNKCRDANPHRLLPEANRGLP